MPAACAALQRVGHLQRVLEHLRHAQPALGNQVDQRFAGDVLHHHELGVAFGDDVVNGDDVGMIQRGSGLRFLDEAAAALRIAGARGGQNLDRDEAVEAGVLGLVDLAHASGAEFFQKLILENSSADHSGSFFRKGEPPEGNFLVCHNQR